MVTCCSFKRRVSIIFTFLFTTTIVLSVVSAFTTTSPSVSSSTTNILSSSPQQNVATTVKNTIVGSSSKSGSKLFAKKRRSGNDDPSSGGGGFGKQQQEQRLFTNMSKEKTYGDEARRSIGSSNNNMIDVEGAMSEFFNTNIEWYPLFRSMARTSSVPAMDYLGGIHGEKISFFDNNDDDNSNFLWKELNDKPTDENHLQILQTFLDSQQQALLDIPVNEFVNEDDDDLNFLEEGRRLLALQRFHVLTNNDAFTGSNINNYDTLFQTVWSELAYLHINNNVNTGSLIVLPDYDLNDLRKFTDMNILRPLDWLGISSDYFEVASMRRSVPALRLIYKLQDMPSLDDINKE